MNAAIVFIGRHSRIFEALT